MSLLVAISAKIFTLTCPGGRECRFDARKVLAVHGADFDLGEHKLDGIHLSQRGVFDDDGYYHCVVKASM